LSMNNSDIFISHTTDEKDQAIFIKRELTEKFPGLEVFVSSDLGTFQLGENWLQVIYDALKSCKVLLVLCSENSLKRPWIHLETGAGWLRNIPIIPMCHNGMKLGELPLPLSLSQGIDLSIPDSWKQLHEIAHNIMQNQEMPEVNYDDLAESVKTNRWQLTKESSTCSPGSDLTPFIWKRMKQVLANPAFEWYFLDRLAQHGGTSEEEAHKILVRRLEAFIVKRDDGYWIYKLRQLDNPWELLQVPENTDLNTLDDDYFIWARAYEVLRWHNYEWYYIDGISRHCGVSDDRVHEILIKHEEVCIAKNDEGRWIYTL
jgi:hypothetical protein